MIVQPIGGKPKNKDAPAVAPVSNSRIVAPIGGKPTGNQPTRPTLPPIKQETTVQSKQKPNQFMEALTAFGTGFIGGANKYNPIPQVDKIPTATFADDKDFFTPLGFVSHIAQGVLNTPGEAMKGATSLIKNAKDGTSTPQQVLGDIAAVAQLPLLLFTGGTSSIAKQGIVGTVKAVTKQSLKETAKMVGKDAFIGAGFGALSGFQSGEEIKDPKEYLKNFLINVGVGGVAGGAVRPVAKVTGVVAKPVISGATKATKTVMNKVVVPLAKGLDNKLGAVFVSNVAKSPVVHHINLSPKVAQAFVLNNNLEKSPVGKAVLKQSILAQKDDLHVSITPSKTGKYTMPGGEKVDVSTSPIFDPTEVKDRQEINPTTTVDRNGTKKNISPTTKATETQVPEVQTKVPEVQTPKVEPVGTGEAKTSRLGLKVERTAIEKKLTKELSDIPQYKQMNMKDQAKQASDLLNMDPERAMRVALGEEAPPKGLLPESVFKALEGSLTDAEQARRLASSPLVSEASALGQRIKALDVETSDSPVEAMRRLIDVRAKAIEKKTGKSVAGATEKTIKDIKSKVKVPDKYDWNKFVDTIKC